MTNAQNLPLPAGLFAPLFDLAHGYDLSWSFGLRAGRWSVERRALFFLPPGAETLAALIPAARALGMDEAALARFRLAMPGADALGLTVAEGGASVRLYLQWWDQMAARVAAGDTGPGLLYLGIKKLAGGVPRDDRYICLPLAPRAEYEPELAAGLTEFGISADDTAALLSPLSPERILWTRSQGAGRDAWLVTLRDAPLPQDRLIAALRALPPSRPGRDALCAALERGALLHIAGGHDTTKGRFITLYVETDAAGMTDFLTNAGLIGGQ